MKILIIHQYFNTPHSGGPLRSYYLAHGLKSNGQQVEIITAHNQNATEVKQIDGITVHYLPVYYDNRLGFLRRIVAFFRFARLPYKKALEIPGIDLCYAISTPLSVGWIARKLKQVKGIPYIFEVGDLWPEAPIQMGVVKFPAGYPTIEEVREKRISKRGKYSGLISRYSAWDTTEQPGKYGIHYIQYVRLPILPTRGKRP